MGTQQLLLIVLGVIIVGIAVVVGINIFGTNAEQANKDAITQDCLRIAAAAQGFYRKPTMLGGGNNSFATITIEDCGMAADDGTPLTGSNVNAAYTVEGTATAFTVTGASATETGKSIAVTVDMTQPEADRITVDDTGW